MELSSFRPWLLKNVQTKDQSEPSIGDLKRLHEIQKFNKEQLAKTKTAEPATTHLYVSQLLANEISSFDVSILRSSKPTVERHDLHKVSTITATFATSSLLTGVTLLSNNNSIGNLI